MIIHFAFRNVRKQATICSFGSDRNKMKVSYFPFQILFVTSTYRIRGKESSNCCVSA